MRRRKDGRADPGAPRFTREDVALLRAAASLAASAEERRRARHLSAPLGELADRLEALLPPLEVAA